MLEKKSQTTWPRFYFDQEMNAPKIGIFLSGSVGVFSSRSPIKTTANEDSAAIIPFDETSGVLVVADGMGGHAAGETASRIAIKEMAASIKQARESDSLLRTGIINGFDRANKAVLAIGAGAGTTLAAVEISDGYARPYHAGDSVVLIFSSRGRVKLETVSHSPVGLGLEAGFLDEEDAAGHEHRHFILNAIGSADMRIEIGSPIKLAKQDTVLVASDGLSDNLSVEQAISLTRSGHLEPSMTNLVRQCREQMALGGERSKPDDLAVIIFRPKK